ncbi:MAG: antibiotic biosynthesis monooxygenase family protein [Terriglobales bacterium]
MFTRLVEINTKYGKTREVADIIQQKVLPILNKQQGFIDEIMLLSTTELNRIVALSFWKSAEDAELYRREQFLRVEELLKPMLEVAPKIHTFDVDLFTTHKIAMGKAA